MDQLSPYNMLAIELIEYLGNKNPAQEQIDLVEYLVSCAFGAYEKKNVVMFKPLS